MGLERTVLRTVPPAEQHASVESVAAMLRDAKRVVALTGAGISVESGIPPFRAPTQAEAEASGSIWGRFDAAKMTVQGFNHDAEMAKYWWALKHSLLPKFSAAAPNPAHKLFGELHRAGKLRAVVTQNIDSLHQAGGVPAESVIELHGNMRGLICSDNETTLNPLPYRQGACDYRCSHEDALRCNYHADTALPLCPKCGAPLRTETVMFGQPMPEKELEAARLAMAEADCLVVVGSTLIVEPANTLPGIALLSGAKLLMVNFDGTKYDEYCEALVRQPAGEFFGRVSEQMQQM